MYNFFHDECKGDPFYMEDEELFDKFQKYVNRISKKYIK